MPTTWKNKGSKTKRQWVLIRYHIAPNFCGIFSEISWLTWCLQKLFSWKFNAMKILSYMYTYTTLYGTWIYKCTFHTTEVHERVHTEWSMKKDNCHKWSVLSYSYVAIIPYVTIFNYAQLIVKLVILFIAKKLLWLKKLATIFWSPRHFDMVKQSFSKSAGTF